MNNPIFEKFLNASEIDRLRIIRNEVEAEALKKFLGEESYKEYYKLAKQLDESHLSAKTPKNLILVPGVMGSELTSKTIAGTWWIDPISGLKLIDKLKLSPDGQEDADPDYQIVPSVVRSEYVPFTTTVLRREDFGMEFFPYDWRKPLFYSTNSLKELIHKTYEKNGKQPIHLVAHSMGGMMVRAALSEFDNELWKKIGRIVFIGTPHYGAASISGYLKNHFWGYEILIALRFVLSRDTFRSLWGVLSLLPAPHGIYPGTRPNDTNPWQSDNTKDTYIHPCANFDMYQAEEWQLELSSEEKNALQNVLDGAAMFHKRMYESHQALTQDKRNKMLVIAGVGYQTLFRLAYRFGVWRYWKDMDKIVDRLKDDPHREGDGRVSVASAKLENVTIRYVKGTHMGLTNIPVVYNEVFSWLNEEELTLSKTMKGALESHLSGGSEERSQAPHLDGTFRAKQNSDDPGLYNFNELAQSEMDNLEIRLKSGDLQEFQRVTLL